MLLILHHVVTLQQCRAPPRLRRAESQRHQPGAAFEPLRCDIGKNNDLIKLPMAEKVVEQERALAC